MAIKARDPTKENTERTIPLQYQEFAKIFSDKEVKHFPPSRPWDHRIRLKPGAPDVINRKVYPLTLEETKVQDKYIDEGLEKGYLRPEEGLYVLQPRVQKSTARCCCPCKGDPCFRLGLMDCMTRYDSLSCMTHNSMTSISST